VGLSTLLGQNTDPDSAIQSIPGVPNLSVLPGGPVPANPSEMLASGRMRELLTTLGAKFDHIILDTPPVLNVTDAVLLSALADYTVLVIRSGVTSKAALRRVHEVLSHVNARILGVVLNAADSTEPDRYYYGNRYRDYYDDSAQVRTGAPE